MEQETAVGSHTEGWKLILSLVRQVVERIMKSPYVGDESKAATYAKFSISSHP